MSAQNVLIFIGHIKGVYVVALVTGLHIEVRRTRGMKYICRKCQKVTMVSMTSPNISFCPECGHNSFSVEGEMFGT